MPKAPSKYHPAESHYWGIDPGASGGLALLSPDGTVQTWKMPATERDLFEILQENRGSHTWAVVEQVGGFIKGNPAPGSAMFNFGKGYGMILMALTALSISYEICTPQRWLKGLAISTRKKTESKTQWKNRLKGAAQRAYPTVTLTLATADALLIATYCQRKHTGTL